MSVLWRTFGNCENYGTLTGHKGAILDLHWSRDSRILFSASADMHLASWDLETGTRIRRHIGHEEVINSMDISKRGEELLISGSDDGTIGIWDPRTKNAVDFIETEFPITAVALAEAGNEIYSGGIDNDIKVWDMRRKAVVYSMLGHTDTISSLRVSPDSQTLLSNSMDSTVRTWDIRPFAPTERHIRTYDGAPAGMEKNLIKASWSSDGKRVAAGSGDGTAVVWNSETGKMIYKLPGHKGTVNCAELSPSSDPISESQAFRFVCKQLMLDSSNRFFGSELASGGAEMSFESFQGGTFGDNGHIDSFKNRLAQKFIGTLLHIRLKLWTRDKGRAWSVAFLTKQVCFPGSTRHHTKIRKSDYEVDVLCSPASEGFVALGGG